MKKIILVAGPTGNLGHRRTSFLLQSGAEVRFFVRTQIDSVALAELEKSGAHVFKVQNWKFEDITRPCKDVSCVVSALAGLKEVVIDAQKIFLEAAIFKNHWGKIRPKEYQTYHRRSIWSEISLHAQYDR
jgi:nucleoside-diphosphate-sugar epimerase